MTRRNRYTKRHALFWDIMHSEADYMACVCAAFYPGDAEMQRELRQQASADLLEALLQWRKENGRQPMPQYYFRGMWQNLCKRHYNRHRAHLQRHCPLPPQLDIAQEESTQEESALRYQQLYDIVDQLPDNDRTLVELYLQDSHYDAIGRQLGITPNNARVRMNRIVQKMKKLAQKYIND